jgi:UDP-N-acetyl-D-glucosamine dehydrogenase
MQTAAGMAGPGMIAAELSEKIRARTARTCVVGLGYVGLPLAVELGQAGYQVIGIDRDPEKVRAIGGGECYIADVEPGRLADLVGSGTLRATTDPAVLEAMDAVSISVPTPLRKTRDPDLSYVVAAAEDLAAHIHPGMLVILESTTYPGTTEEAILPVIERSGLKVGRDFFLCFSPERVDPGNKEFHTRNIPKVIGGMTPACTEMGALFYSQFMDQVVPVSSTRVAEMVKLMENTFRMINIALANEMALMCDHMNIDVWEVIEAAATKPFGFMPFYPGPGLGGHCIPVDPLYLSWKSKQTGHEARLIDLAAQINVQMPRFVVDKVQAALNDRSKPVKGSSIHIVGVAYKRDVSDIRESPALDIIKLLGERGGEMSYTDPLVPRIEIESRVLESQALDVMAKATDCVLVVADHSSIDYDRLLADADLVVDTRNRYQGVVSDKIVRL